MKNFKPPHFYFWFLFNALCVCLCLAAAVFPRLSVLDWITVSHRMAACSVARIEDLDNSYFAIWQFLELVLCFGPLNHLWPLKIIVFSIVNPNFKFVHLFYLNVSSLWGHISKTVNKIGLFCQIFCFFVQKASRLAFHPLIFWPNQLWMVKNSIAKMNLNKMQIH